MGAHGLQAAGQQVSAAEACGGSCAASSLNFFQACDVASGTYKYVQVHASAPDGAKKVIVRSAPGAYHADVAESLCQELSARGLKYQIPGGGRIRRDDTKKEIEIYGHSKGFGLPDHSISASICQEAFPGYVVTHRDTGY